jgi:hypothetical protein
MPPVVALDTFIPMYEEAVSDDDKRVGGGLAQRRAETIAAVV